MRYGWLALLALVCAPVYAQAVTPGISIPTVVHEPDAGQVGPYIAGIQLPNPDFNPQNPNGQPQFVGVFGNGNGLEHLPDSSGEFFARGATTSHDLALFRNNTASDLLISGASADLAVVQWRPKKDVPTKPERADPGFFTQVLYPYDNVSIAVPAGSTVALFLMVTSWFDQVDTSPREYVVRFRVRDTLTNTDLFVEADCIVPEVEDRDGESCSVSSGSPSPQAAIVMLAGGLAAILPRGLKRLRRKKA
jgi:hypothetical protein